MSQTSHKTVLITGANAAIGKETARQLGLRDEIGRVYLACRNALTAEAARQELERASGRSIFEVVVVDLSDLASVRSVKPRIQLPLNAMVMNAGEMGGRTPMALTADGVTELFAGNVLGHVALLEDLVAAEGLTESALFAGSRPPEVSLPSTCRGRPSTNRTTASSSPSSTAHSSKHVPLT